MMRRLPAALFVAVLTAAHLPAPAMGADTLPPILTAPTARLAAHARVTGAAVASTIAWAPAVDASGVASYEVRRSVDGAAWTAVALPSPTTSSIGETFAPNHRYRFAVRATDGAGNTSPWVEGPSFQVRLVSERSTAIRWSTGWRTTTWSGFLGHQARSTTRADATATFTFTGREVGWVAPYGTTRGSARITVDGRYVATVDLHRDAGTPPRLAWSRAWPSVGRHTVSIRALGTSTHPRVDLDGFVVVDAPPPDPVIVGAGDIASCGRTQDEATARLLDGIAGTVFTTGDNAYDRGTPSEFAKCYAPSWGRHLRRTRPAPGNHDYATPGAAGYYAYFGWRAGTAGKGWYSYDRGSWRIYVLNSNCGYVGCGAGSAQERWLRSDLAAHPHRCVAAIWHHPRFSSGRHGDHAFMAPIWDALVDANAELVITGHDHDYERFAPQLSDGTASPDGLREIVVGTGGAGLRPFVTRKPNSEVRDASSHGVLKLTLRPSSYRWDFVPALGGTFRDSGSAQCR